MSPTPQLFRIDAEEKRPEAMREVEFSTEGLQERYDIQEWIAADPRILSDDLFIIAKEFSDFDKTNERLDLLAVDRNGRLVIIELKRDDSGPDVHMQAIKYASYLQRADAAKIIEILTEYNHRHLQKQISEDEARQQLLDHLESGDLEALNSKQRIIIASHRFAPEVTSAVLWLNEQTGQDLITCIQLTPYKDENALYLQSNTLIPVPGTEHFRIHVGKSGITRQPSHNPDTDQVRQILSRVVASAKARVATTAWPDKTQRGTQWGWWHLWYGEKAPWKNWDFCANIILRRKNGIPNWLVPTDIASQINGEWIAGVQLHSNIGLPEGLQLALASLSTGSSHFQSYRNGMILRGVNELDDEFTGQFAGMVCQFIDTTTPLVDEAYEHGEFDSSDANEESPEEDE